MAKAKASPLIEPTAAAALASGDHGDPFAVLGLHKDETGWVLRVLAHGAETVEAITKTGKRLVALESTGHDGVFAAKLTRRPAYYRLRATHGTDAWEFEDPYRFLPVIGDIDEHLLAEGSHRRLWEVLGAHPMTIDGIEGTHFAVWAPNAKRVSVVGDFNAWDGRRNPMRVRGATGIWEIFLPGVVPGAAYKYQIKAQGGTVLPEKADPVGFGAEHPPATASIVRRIDGRNWRDADWIARRADRHRIDQPISIYEAHLGSWRRADDGARPLSYTELSESLVPYVRDMGFTHLELLPITEHPFDGSWGYQPVGLYAPTIRHGTLDEFRDFVETCHGADIGLILDWVPGHFPTDAHGLGVFDGTPIYEYSDPREGFHQDWNTLIYNFDRREVANFLIANAVYWLKEHHLDGLRVDAVASMLYRDYSRNAGEWVPNFKGGRENLEAVAFLKHMNEQVYAECPGIVTMAEESTAWPGVTRPTDHDGLGFGYKWNMGWMNDTLDYIGRDPIHRSHHHHQMTFGLNYAFSENFVLPLSHDEVVHGKGTILGRMPGDEFDKFANMRAYLGFMWGHPGKKLLFMGQEFAQADEWNHDQSLDWHLTESARHEGMQNLVRDLNRLYRQTPALHQGDCKSEGFEWIDADAADASVYAWVRYGEGATPPVLVVCNFTPVDRSGWRFGVPAIGHWIERLNTDAQTYGGVGRGNLGGVDSEPIPWNERSASVMINLPPLSTLVFELE